MFVGIDLIIVLTKLVGVALSEFEYIEDYDMSASPATDYLEPKLSRDALCI